jgi:LPXTG-motif cell wall-anchored protein
MNRLARVTLASLATLSLAVGGALVGAAPVMAASYEVTNDVDGGPDSLRDAINSANANPGLDTITFAPGLGGGDLFISLGTLEITDDLIIQGPGVIELNIVLVGVFDLFAANGTTSPDVTISDVEFVGNSIFGSEGSGFTAVGAGDLGDLTLTNTGWGGFVNDLGGALAINSASGDITITDSTFVSNEAVLSGGAVYLDQIDGDVIISGSTFRDNLAQNSDGGAVNIFESASVSITDSSFTENTAIGTGGALFLDSVDGESVIERTEFSNNTAGEQGSLFNEGGTIAILAVLPDASLTIRQSSILDSTLQVGDEVTYGAGMYIDNINGDLTIDSSTFARSAFVNVASPAGGLGLSIAVCTVTAGGSMTVINSTFDESDGFDSFAIHVCDFEGELDILYSTLVAPAVLFIETNNGSAVVSSSILDALTASDAVFVDAGDPVVLSWSLSSTPTSSSITNGPGNRFSVANMGLAPLADNGGPTPTRLLLPSSPALDMGDPAVTGQPAFDQRGTGYPRVVGGRIDIGAIEMPRTLPATGAELPVPLLIGGILLIIVGAALIIVRIRRRA